MKKLLFLLTLSILISCSDSPSDTSSKISLPPTFNGFFFATAAAAVSSLPTCDSSLEGRIFYLQSDSLFKSCSGGSWTTLNITGSAGPTGPTGPQGEIGDWLPVMRFTRALIPMIASDEDKTLACQNELGLRYEAAVHPEAFFYGSNTKTGFFVVKGNTIYTFGKETVSWLNGSVRAFDGYTSRPLACIKTGAPIRITSTTHSYSLGAAEKDTICNSSFGSNYHAGTSSDFIYNAKRFSGISGISVSNYSSGYVSTSSDSMAYTVNTGQGKVLCMRFQ